MVVKVKLRWCHFMGISGCISLIDDDFLMMTDATRKKWSFFNSERIPMKRFGVLP